MYLDTMCAVRTGKNEYRYSYIDTWGFGVWSQILRKEGEKAVIDFNKQLYKDILTIEDNTVPGDILKRAPCNGVMLVFKNGKNRYLKTKPVPGGNAETWIQEQIKNKNDKS